MFKIEPIQDKTRQKEICRKFCVEYNEDFFGYYMFEVESGEPMGFSQFEISGEEGYIKNLLSYNGLDDFEAMFILGRQTMNFINFCGAEECYANSSIADKKLLSAIGFKQTVGERLYVKLTGMFDGHCNH